VNYGQAKPQTLQAIAQIGAPALPLLVHAAPMTALTAMDKLLFWLGLGAAQKGARSKEVKPSRHWVVSLVAGILLALLIAAGAFILLVSQQ
jgi:hypothetical protein